MKSFDSWARELASELSDKTESGDQSPAPTEKPGDTSDLKKGMYGLFATFRPLPVTTGKDHKQIAELPSSPIQPEDMLVIGGSENNTRHFTYPKMRVPVNVTPADFKIPTELEDRSMTQSATYKKLYGLVSQEQLKDGGSLLKERVEHPSLWPVGNFSTISGTELFSFLSSFPADVTWEIKGTNLPNIFSVIRIK